MMIVYVLRCRLYSAGSSHLRTETTTSVVRTFGSTQPLKKQNCSQQVRVKESYQPVLLLVRSATRSPLVLFCPGCVARSLSNPADNGDRDTKRSATKSEWARWTICIFATLGLNFKSSSVIRTDGLSRRAAQGHCQV
jgi:hypothetical protein